MARRSDIPPPTPITFAEFAETLDVGEERHVTAAALQSSRVMRLDQGLETEDCQGDEVRWILLAVVAMTAAASDARRTSRTTSTHTFITTAQSVPSQTTRRL
jgi:hypothetical protein